MASQGSQAARSWALFLFYVAAVLGTLPFTRGLTLSLRNANMLTLSIVALYVFALAAVAYKVVFSENVPDVFAFAGLVGCAGVTAALMVGLEIPEERVHFLQYGLMAWLAGAALREHMSPKRSYLAAFLLTAAIGWGDELLQDILPNRVYDLRDVVFNAQAALLGVISDELLHNRLGWRERRGDVARADRR